MDWIRRQLQLIWCAIKKLQSNQGIQSIQEGDNITVDNTDPLNPIVSSTASGGTSIHNDLTGIQGGKPGEYIHLTQEELNKVNNFKEVDTLTTVVQRGSNFPTSVTADFSGFFTLTKTVTGKSTYLRLTGLNAALYASDSSNTGNFSVSANRANIYNLNVFDANKRMTLNGPNSFAQIADIEDYPTIHKYFMPTTVSTTPNKDWTDGTYRYFTDSTGVNKKFALVNSVPAVDKIALVSPNGNIKPISAVVLSNITKVYGEDATGATAYAEAVEAKKVNTSNTEPTILELIEQGVDRIDYPNLGRIYFNYGTKWGYITLTEVV